MACACGQPGRAEARRQRPATRTEARHIPVSNEKVEAERLFIKGSDTIEIVNGESDPLDGERLMWRGHRRDLPL